MNRRDLLKYAVAAAGGGLAGAALFSRRRGDERQPNVLRLPCDTRSSLLEMARRRQGPVRFGCGFPSPSELGRAYSPYQIEDFKAKFAALFNALTVENALKWREVERERGKYVWADADEIVAWAASSGIAVKMHCALWGVGQGIPDWAPGLSDAELRKAILDFAGAVAARYKGAFWAWDIVNEPLHQTYYIKRLPGIDKELVALVRSLEPKAVLLVNECDTIEYPPSLKRRGLGADLVQYVKSIGADAAGEQAHDPRWYTREELKSTFRLYAEAGVPLHLTELIRPSDDRPIHLGDSETWNSLVPGGALGTWTEEAQADGYEDVVLTALSNDSVGSVSIWNFCDNKAWDYYPLGGLLRPDLSAKPAYYRLQRLMAELAKRGSTQPSKA